MANPLLALRIGNLLQNLGGQPVQAPQQQPNLIADLLANGGSVNGMQTDPGMSADLPYDAGARMAQLYQPRTAINDQYTAALGNAPERNNPGALRNIAALVGSSMSSYRNPAVAMKLFDEARFAPYYRAQDDYQQNLKNLAVGASEEDRYNTNQRQLAEQTVSREQNQAKIDEAARSNTAKEKIAQQRADTADRRAQAYIWKQTHQDWKAAPTKGGNLMFVNPQDPTQTIDTGIPLGTMTDLEKAQFGLDARLQEIKTQGVESRKTVDERANKESGLIQQRGQVQSGLIKERANNKPITNADGTITITTGPQGTTTRTNIKVAPTQRVRVVSPDGKQSGTIEAREVNLLPNGWTVAGVSK